MLFRGGIVLVHLLHLFNAISYGQIKFHYATSVFVLALCHIQLQQIYSSISLLHIRKDAMIVRRCLGLLYCPSGSQYFLSSASPLHAPGQHNSSAASRTAYDASLKRLMLFAMMVMVCRWMPHDYVVRYYVLVIAVADLRRI